MSQAATARAIRITRQHFNGVLCGKYPPTRELAARLIHFVGEEYSDLILISAGYIPDDVGEVIRRWPTDSCAVLRALRRRKLATERDDNSSGEH